MGRNGWREISDRCNHEMILEKGPGTRSQVTRLQGRPNEAPCANSVKKEMAGYRTLIPRHSTAQVRGINHSADRPPLAGSLIANASQVRAPAFFRLFRGQKLRGKQTPLLNGAHRSRNVRRRRLRVNSLFRLPPSIG
jgi:hypothetical protein